MHPDRSPDLKKQTSNLGGSGSDPRGKTFTATRIGNLSNSKADQFFHSSGDRHHGQQNKPQHIAQHRLSKGPSDTITAYGGSMKEPNSPA